MHFKTFDFKIRKQCLKHTIQMQTNNLLAATESLNTWPGPEANGKRFYDRKIMLEYTQHR